jgi:two-component system, chemotaxis family, sensor kinase CheA
MNLDDARDMFIAESRDCLHVMEQQLLAMEQQLATNQVNVDNEALNQLFRAAHTIKGSAGLFALDAIVEFTHVVENVLDAVRRSKLVADRALITLLLNAGDYLGALLDTLTAGTMPALDDAGRTTMAALSAHLGPAALAASAPLTPAALSPDAIAPVTNRLLPPAASNGVVAGAVANSCWHLSLRFYADVMRDGMDPLAFLHYLSRHGTIKCLRLLPDDLPSCDDFDAELLYTGFEIDLASTADADTIASTFEFVREQSLIEILPPNASLDQYRRLTWLLPEPEQRLHDLWVGEMQSLTEQEWCDLQALSLVSAVAPVVETQVAPQVADAAIVPIPPVPRETAKTSAREAKSVGRTREARFIKIDAGKLDQLIGLVGELVISTAATQLQAQRLADSANSEAVVTVMNLVEQVRDSALSLRMVAMSEVFNRFPRVVRDVAQELGKEIELKIDGADAELDKSLVEKLTDPLTHIVRNAIDHGIESVDVRVAAGKPRHGTVCMSARHDAGGIVIEVSDDGGGLKRDKILAKAIEKQLISADAQPSDNEVWQLLFLPGFSTAEAVTNLSGRGVGMDVVKRNIESQHGSVEFDSVAGEGTQLRIRLPLTLAIIDGFQFAVGPHRFVVPLDAVIECFELTALTQDVATASCVNLRGEVLPLVKIAKLYELNDCHGDGHSVRQNVVVVQAGQRRAGLVVDTLQGELQAVIKPLSRLFRGLRGVGGSTVLGSGDVALILDVAQLIGLAQSVSQRVFIDQH